MREGEATLGIKKGLPRRLPRAAQLALALALATSPRPGIAAKVDSLNVVAQARKTMMSDPARVIPLGESLDRQARAMPAGQDRVLAIARAQWIIAEGNNRTSQFEVARKAADTALAFAASSGDKQLRADILITRGSIRQSSGDPAAAMFDYMSAYNLVQKSGDARTQAIALINLGALYTSAYDYTRAERYFRQAGEVHTSDEKLQIALLNSLGDLAISREAFHQAIPEYVKAAEIARLAKLPALELHVLSNLGYSQILVGDHVAARQTIRSMTRLLDRMAPSLPTVQVRTTFAFNLYTNGDISGALAQVTPIFARPGPKDLPQYETAHRVAYLVYKASGLYETALDHLETYRKLREDASRVAVSTRGALMAAQFDFTNQELRISQLKAADLRRDVADERTQRDRQTFVFLVVTGSALIVIGLLLASLVSSRRARGRVNEMNVALQAALAEVRDREEAAERATLLAEQDALTKLPNRRHLNDKLYPRMTACVTSGDETAVLLLDLDRFKPINDTYGHEAGDAVLIEAARRMQAVCDGFEATPVRLGGDEFVVILNGMSGGHIANMLAALLIQEISKPYAVADTELNIGTSIGIARHLDANQSIDDLLRNADTAMYEAKRAGRGAFRLYSSGMDEKPRRRSDFEADRRAAARRGQSEDGAPQLRAV